jgi:hypothetical protein
MLHFTNGKSVAWSEGIYNYDINGFMFLTKKVNTNYTNFQMVFSNMTDFVPYQIKMLILHSDPFYTCDLFDAALRRCELHRENVDYWDVDDGLKDVFDTLGFEVNEALAVKNKHFNRSYHEPISAVYEYHLQCAVEQAVCSGNPIYLKKSNLKCYNLFLTEKVTYVEIRENCGTVTLRGLNDLGDRKTLQFYPSCRNNFTTEGKMWPRKPSSNWNISNTGGNIHDFCKNACDSCVLSFLEEYVSGSEEALQKCKRLIPSSKFWFKQGDLPSRRGISLDILSDIFPIPTRRYTGTKLVSFADLLRSKYYVPSFVEVYESSKSKSDMTSLSSGIPLSQKLMGLDDQEVECMD